MKYNLYSRLNQQIVEGSIIGISFLFAYLIRFDGAITPFDRHQLWVLMIPFVSGRLLTNYLFGLHRIQWRYVSAVDTLPIVLSYMAFSGVVGIIRIALPHPTTVARVPGSIIAIECLLSLMGAMGIRLLRRYIYERQSKGNGKQNAKSFRRLLLVGAGIKGQNVAKEMALDSSVEIIGFLDDDPRKIGSVIAGATVIGSTSQLAEIVRTQRVDAVLVCIASGSRGAFDRLVAILDGLPITSKFVPTVTEILDSEKGFQMSIASSNGNNGHGDKVEHHVSPPVQTQIKNKSILITGGAGFIGSTLAERLAENNEVVLLDRFFENQPVSFTSLHHNRNVSMIEADILDGAEIAEYARRAEIVVHAAAIVGVGRVCTYPRETLETNFIGTSRMLKMLDRNSRLQRFLYFSTSEVFGVNSFRVHEETPTAVGPAAEARWSYAIAKLAGEHLVKAYHRQSGMPVVTVRPFNVFGPRRLGAHAILGFVLNSLTGRSIEVHGDGSQIRSWCYIDDFCDAIMQMLSEPRAIGEDFNIGNPQNTVTILQLAQEIIRTTGKSVPIEMVESPFPDIEIRVPSLDKARELLDYRPKYDLRQGLELTVDWYRKNLEFFESLSASAVTAGSGDK